jgi:hypothetical protein
MNREISPIPSDMLPDTKILQEASDLVHVGDHKTSGIQTREEFDEAP